ncbi:MAG: putative LPS assembly protein LptD [Chitinispirillia bacterium]|jgi:lipopolysaccharide assembly outer membrane protein LptD (OstA)
MKCKNRFEKLFILLIYLSLFSVPNIFGQWTGYNFGKQAVNDSLSRSDSLSKRFLNDSITDSDTSVSSEIVRDTIDYEADIIEYDRVNKIILLRNNAVLKYKDIELYADTIHYLIEEKSIVATGYPQWIQTQDTAVGEYMVYNLGSRRGRVKHTTAHLDDSKYDSKQLAMSDDENFYMEEGDYTSCAVIDSPHYCFYGKHIKVIPNKRVYCRPVVLNIGGAPVAILPYWIIPLEKGRRSGWLTPNFGGNPTHGGYINNVGYYWAPNDYTDYLISGNLKEFSSLVIKAETNYALRYWINGSISGRYSISANKEDLKNIWELNYGHSQNILPDESMRLSGRGSIVSEKTFFKSVSEDTVELKHQQVTSNMSLTKKFHRINANSSLTWNRSHNFRTNKIDHDLPSFSFNLSSRPLIPYKDKGNTNINDEEDREKWYHSISYSYSYKANRRYSFKKRGRQNDSLFNFFGMNHGIPVTAPFKLFRWFNLSPNFSFSQSFFNAYIGNIPYPVASAVAITDTVHSDSVFAKNVIDTLVDEKDTLYVCSTGVTVDTFYYYDTTSFHWSNDNLSKFQTYSWNTGISLSTQLYGVFPIRIFNLNGIRHTFTPSVSYTFYPEKKMSRTFPEVRVSYPKARDRGQVVGFSFGNLFQGRITPRKEKGKNEPVEKKFTFLNGSINTSYDFEKKTRKWSNIGLSAGIPNKIIGFSYSSSFTPYDDGNRLVFPKLLSYSISLRPNISGARGTFWGGDFLLFHEIQPEDYMEGYTDLKTPTWSINFNPSYTFSRSRSRISEKFKTTKSYRLSTSADIKFTNIWSMSWSSNFDFTKNKFMNHSMNFYCDLECFDLRFNWYPSGLNKGSFRFIIRIKKHPEIKWDHPENN